MAEGGVTHPPDATVKFVRKLVAGLALVPSETKIRLETQGAYCRFSIADSGVLLAEITFPDKGYQY
jgi:hypothetical protein